MVSMICRPEAVVTGFPVWASTGEAIAAPPEMTASVNTADRREHIGIELPPCRIGFSAKIVRKKRLQRDNDAKKT